MLRLNSSVYIYAINQIPFLCNMSRFGKCILFWNGIFKSIPKYRSRAWLIKQNNTSSWFGGMGSKIFYTVSFVFNSYFSSCNFTVLNNPSFCVFFSKVPLDSLLLWKRLCATVLFVKEFYIIWYVHWHCVFLILQPNQYHAYCGGQCSIIQLH